MTVFIVFFLAFTALLAFLMCCDVPDSKLKNRNTTSVKVTTHNTQNDRYDNHPNYAQQNMQRIMREEAQRMHDQFIRDAQKVHQERLDIHQALMESHHASVDMHHQPVDFGCGGFGTFF